MARAAGALVADHGAPGAGDACVGLRDAVGGAARAAVLGKVF